MSLTAVVRGDIQKVYGNDFTVRGVIGHWKSNNAIGKFYHSTSEGNKVPGAICIEIDRGCPIKSSFLYMFKTELTPGLTYTGTIYVKGIGMSETGYVEMRFRVCDNKGRITSWETVSPSTKIKLKTLTSNWNKLEHTFKVPTEGEWNKSQYLLCLISVTNATYGKIYFDDLTISTKE